MLMYSPNGRSAEMVKKDVLERKLAQLESLSGPETKEMFQELFGFECGPSNGKNIKKRLVCTLQEIYSGGVPETDLLILRKIAEADDKANLRQTAKIKKLTRGTRLVKEWKGKCYSVTATGDGRYEYDGEIYRSLSAVADKITGTHWNGKKFFGVE